MNKITYTLYTLILLFVSASAHAAPDLEANSLGVAMVISILSGLAGLGVTYLVWRQGQLKRRQTTPKPVNRGPVKRPIEAYQRKRVFS